MNILFLFGWSDDGNDFDFQVGLWWEFRELWLIHCSWQGSPSMCNFWCLYLAVWNQTSILVILYKIELFSLNLPVGCSLRPPCRPHHHRHRLSHLSELLEKWQPGVHGSRHCWGRSKSQMYRVLSRMFPWLQPLPLGRMEQSYSYRVVPGLAFHQPKRRK